MQVIKNVTVELSVFERIVIPSILPIKGNYETGLILSDLKKKLQISQEEMDSLEFVSTVTEGVVNYNWSEEREAEQKKFSTELTRREYTLLVRSIVDMNNRGELPISDPRYMALFERFGLEEGRK